MKAAFAASITWSNSGRLL